MMKNVCCKCPNGWWYGLLLLLIMQTGYLAAEENKTVRTVEDTAVVGTIGYAQERFKPAPVYNGPTRSGKEVYEYSCATCHDRTTQGAPLPDDDVEWGMRARKGIDVLLKHVKEGYKDLMPEMGGCRNCTDEELLASILYIMETSGIIIPEMRED
ncbi:MAG: cytochrome c5 family protein [Burkholderiales bacterium]|nr:cytochrome c5 family protein [Burkholderiales bacterium]MDR4517859.1 c-type cytochrome [Nitrosomonas sp.]